MVRLILAAKRRQRAKRIKKMLALRQLSKARARARVHKMLARVAAAKLIATR